MRYFLMLLIGSMFVLNSCESPNTNKTEVLNQDFQIVFYNVENLFDTIDTPDKMDEEFTPSSEKKWNSERYFTKQKHLAEVIKSIGENQFPALIGLEEVENRAVLEDLAQQDVLSDAHYKIIHYESPDFRGIDNALLYRPDVFEPIYEEAIAVKMPDSIAYINGHKLTNRDILYVKGIIHQKDTLHIFINHWTSMYYGEKETVPHRNYCAYVLKQKTDSILDFNPMANIIAGGDLNEDVFAPAVNTVLKVDTSFNTIQNDHLYNLTYDLFTKQGRGTYNYKGEWGVLDHIIVSGALLSKNNSIYTNQNWINTFDSDMVMNYYDNKFGKGKRPNRTYGGNRYFGGYSDHLAIYLKLNIVN